MQYLFAVFKRELGCTPREYQQRIGNGVASPADGAANDADACVIAM